MSNDGIVLSLCDRTGNMVRPWAEAGYECWCIDKQHTGRISHDNVTWIGADLLTWQLPGCSLPDCVCVSAMHRSCMQWCPVVEGQRVGCFIRSHWTGSAVC